MLGTILFHFFDLSEPDLMAILHVSNSSDHNIKLIILVFYSRAETLLLTFGLEMNKTVVYSSELLNLNAIMADSAMLKAFSFPLVVCENASKSWPICHATFGDFLGIE